MNRIGVAERCTCLSLLYAHCVPKTSTFLFFEIFCQKLTDFNDFGVLNPKKIWHHLYICPPHLCSVTTLPWGIQKIIFQQYYSYIYTSDYLHYVRRKQTVTPPYSPHLKNVTALPCKMQNLFMWLKVMLRFPKRWWLWKELVVGWHW